MTASTVQLQQQQQQQKQSPEREQVKAIAQHVIIYVAKLTGIDLKL